ncbi:tetratricopeptide repeat protein [Endozoicomonas sp.]|uniref:tetratricopeptide repeat protein n=1 Tax=Endozoicomonas sp. TaxID=1892382 RepID=UPI00383A19E8
MMYQRIAFVLAVLILPLPTFAFDPGLIKATYQQELAQADAGVYPLLDGFIVKGVSVQRPGMTRQQTGLNAEKQVLALISKTRSEAVNKQVANALHRKLLARKGLVTDFQGELYQIEREASGKQYRYVVYVKKAALTLNEKLPELTALTGPLKDLLQEEIKTKNYKALALYFSDLGVTVLSDYYGAAQLKKTGVLTGSFPSVGGTWTVINAGTREEISTQLNGTNVSCPVLQMLAEKAGGTIKKTLGRIEAASCQTDRDLPDWYQSRDDFRNLVAYSLTGNGSLIFSRDALYGSPAVAEHFQRLADGEFSQGIDPVKTLSMQTLSLSQQPINARGWNQLGAVLRAMGQYPLALAAHQQAIMATEPTATTLIHIAKTYQAMGDMQKAIAYSQITQLLSFSDFTSTWVQASLGELTQMPLAKKQTEIK